MTITSPTDDELREFLALDEARTPGEWPAHDGDEGDEGVYLVEIHDGHSLGYDYEGSCPMCFANIDYIAMCSRIARAVVEELLERRASDRQMWDHLRQINAEEAD